MNFGIDVDASKTGLGARLFQYNDNEPSKKFTIGYASRSLKNAEKNYTITELECLALIFALKKWHTLLMGRKIKINTDHRALQFVSSCANASERIARWMSFMQEFDLQIQHIPGKDNKTADALSREFDEKSTRARKENIFEICPMLQEEENYNSRQWYDMIKKAQESDERIKRELTDPETNCRERDGLVRRTKQNEERIIVPDEVAWRLIESIHKFLLHFGTDKVVDFGKKYFEINNIDRITRDIVASCEICIATKYYTRPTRGIEYYELPDDKDKTISLDIFGPLPRTQSSNRYIIVMMDQFSKLTNCYPVTNQKLQTIIETIETKYLEKMPIPETILTDNGGQFLTEEWKRYAERRGFQVRKTSPYNPQSNPVERVMRELGRVIRAYYHEKHTQWDTIVERFVETVNNTQHFSTGETPAELYPEKDNELRIDERILPAILRVKDRQETVEEIKRHLKKKAADRKRQTDKHGEAKEYKIGDMVWVRLHRRSDASRRITRKIHLVYQGPYKIKEIIRKNAYLIDLNGQTIGTYNSRQLRPHRESKFKINREHDESSQQQNAIRIGVIRVKPIRTLKHEQSTQNPIKITELRTEPDNTNIEIKEEIVSDEECGNTNYFALERYNEKLIKINGTPIAYNYQEHEARKVETKDKIYASTSQAWFTSIHASQSDQLPPVKQYEQKTDGQTIITGRYENEKTNTN